MFGFRKNKAQIQLLNALITINIDRIKGYQKLEKLGVDYPNILMVAAGKAQQSQKYIERIKEIIREIGGEPLEEQSIEGSVFRVWMNIKNMLNIDDYKNILMNCEFGENTALKLYDETLPKLKRKLEDAAFEDLLSQRDGIYRSINEIQDLYKPIAEK
ncbi:MAG: hypothetical protein BGO87_00640 [Flavobacteriia bacterium 40-80]|nr:MAG: hypothetical protein BGO87_00640 [Flavobacteriia bacterium 40-80]